MSIHIYPVSTLKRKRDFIDIPWKLHQSNPAWVPPLKQVIKKMLNTRKHPFYEHAELALWVAYRNEKPVGRIAGILNHKHNHYHNENIAFWGFFETEDCHEVAAALFHTVEDWAKQKGTQSLRGPVNLSLNYECGMQISSFDTHPFLMMTQNPAYYPKLVESLNYHKAVDMNAWVMHPSAFKFLHPRLETIHQKLVNHPEIIIRPLEMRNYYQEIALLLEIYNDAWKENWGFVPMSEREAHQMAKELKKIIIPELVYFVIVEGEPAAFGLCLPNINQVLRTIYNGKLFPTGFLKLLWYLKKKNYGEGRIPLLGIKQKFRHLQLGLLLYVKYQEILQHLNMTNIECSWILESNKAMNFGLKNINAQLYKIYRIYEKLLD